MNHLRSRDRLSVARAALNPTSTLHSPTSGNTTHPVLTGCFQESGYRQPDEFTDRHVRVPSRIDESRVSFLAQHPERDPGTVVYNCVVGHTSDIIITQSCVCAISLDSLLSGTLETPVPIGESEPRNHRATHPQESEVA